MLAALLLQFLQQLTLRNILSETLRTKDTEHKPREFAREGWASVLELKREGVTGGEDDHSCPTKDRAVPKGKIYVRSKEE